MRNLFTVCRDHVQILSTSDQNVTDFKGRAPCWHIEEGDEDELAVGLGVCAWAMKGAGIEAGGICVVSNVLASPELANEFRTFSVGSGWYVDFETSFACTSPIPGGQLQRVVVCFCLSIEHAQL